MNKRRLLKLAALLEADAKNRKGVRFDYQQWAYLRNEKAPISCDTTACALGLAAISGAFRRAGGLSYYRIFDGKIEFTVNGFLTSALNAAETVFDLAAAEARFIFVPHGGDLFIGARAERAVAKKIRKFVAGEIALVATAW